MNSMKRILLVDDDPALQEIFSIGLEAEGFKVTLAEDGRKAQEIVKQEKFDLIVLDLLMPVMDGLRFTRWLRDEEKMSTPVVILSSMVSQQNKDELLALGAVDALSKPIGLDAFLEKVNSLIWG